MKKSKRMLCLTVVFFWASEYCHAPYFTPYLSSLGFTAGVIGIMVGTYGLTQTIVRIPLGIFTDKTGWYVFVVRMGTILTTISSFLLIFATSEWTIIFCRVLAGMAASTWIAFTVLFSSYYDANDGTSAMLGANMCNNIGKLMAFILGMIAATLWGYRIPLVMSFLTGIVAIYCAFQLKSVPVKREPVKFYEILKTFKDATVLLPAFFAVIMQFILQGTAFSFTSGIAASIGGNKIQIGLVTMIFTVVQIAAAGVAGKYVIKRLGVVLSAAVGFAFLGMSCLIIVFAKSVYVVMVAQVFGGIGNLITASVLMGLAIRYVTPEKKSTAMGLFQAIYGIGMTLGPIVVGRAVDLGGYSFAYAVCTGVCIMAMVLSLAILPIANRIGEKREEERILNRE